MTPQLHLVDGTSPALGTDVLDTTSMFLLPELSLFRQHYMLPFELHPDKGEHQCLQKENMGRHLLHLLRPPWQNATDQVA